jgi:hypothetical protein
VIFGCGGGGGCGGGSGDVVVVVGCCGAGPDYHAIFFPLLSTRSISTVNVRFTSTITSTVAITFPTSTRSLHPPRHSTCSTHEHSQKCESRYRQHPKLPPLLQVIIQQGLASELDLASYQTTVQTTTSIQTCKQFLPLSLPASFVSNVQSHMQWFSLLPIPF